MCEDGENREIYRAYIFEGHLVSACVGAAATIEETEKVLKETGFGDIRIQPKDESRELIRKWAPGGNAGDHVVSATIEAVKPS